MTGRIRRYVEILIRLLPFAVAFLRDRRRFVIVGRGRNLPDERHEKRAKRLTETLLGLGPAFIKAGQVLSTRPDLVPPIYADELATLQDQVPESEDADPRTVIEAELGSDVLDRETIEPIAGGSLAYVYAARRADTGERVAVKVRRPAVKDRVQRDLQIIRRLLPLVSLFAPERHQYSLRNIADDFEEIILQELDFEREAAMMERIRENLAEDDRVHVPRADMAVSTRRVLVMEHVEGRKITDEDAFRTHDIGRTEFAERIIDIYLRMGLEDGVFHADPHPGNLAVGEDGRLVIYDFGMSKELSQSDQKQIIDLYVSLSRRDTDGLTEALIELGVLDPGVDRQEIRRVLEMAMESLAGRPQITWRDIIAELTFTLRDFPFRIPPDVMLLLRVGTVGEGVCRRLDPEFDFLSAVQSYLIREGHAERELRSQMRELQTELTRSLPIAVELPRRLDTTLQQLERGEITVQTADEGPPRAVEYAIISAGLFVAAALLYPHTGVGTAVATATGILFLGTVLLKRFGLG